MFGQIKLRIGGKILQVLCSVDWRLWILGFGFSPKCLSIYLGPASLYFYLFTRRVWNGTEWVNESF